MRRTMTAGTTMFSRMSGMPVRWWSRYAAAIALHWFFVLGSGGGPVALAQVAGQAQPGAAAKPGPSNQSVPPDRQADAQAIREAGARYLQAMERGDAKALADLWTADGDIIDDQGTVMNGRETVALAVQPATGQPVQGNGLRMKETQLRFLAPDVAIEDGTVEIVPAGAAGHASTPAPAGASAARGRFTATWVKQDSAWRIAGLRESKIDAGGGQPRLADLDWMVGDWGVIDNTAAAGGEGTPGEGQTAIEVSVRWNATRTFLLRDMKISKNGGPATHITQRIGWDPLARQIHSWMFAADGAHGEGFWTRDGDAWIARTASVMPDGSQMSALNIYVYDGLDRCTWRSFHTHVGSDHLPPVNMTMIRKPGSGPK